jgi:hypothetical protein
MVQATMLKEVRIGIIILGVGTILFGYAFLAAIPSLIKLLSGILRAKFLMFQQLSSI